ncbi:MAG: hypothetical protein HN426_09475 [Nitrospina sp.]|nr:hypothetical protein [Nitrospina sp.]MBT7935718.1 hypothetical protein [Nitrospina sp.]
MIEKIMASLESLPTEDLLEIRKNLDELIRSKYDDDLGKRKGKRAKVKIAGNVEIEREKEFFFNLHKIVLLEMSVNGLVFSIKATVIDGDILRVSFRVPSTGEKKIIDCQAVRVQETKPGTIPEYEVAAIAVSKEAVKDYKDMLRKRGQ